MLKDIPNLIIIDMQQGMVMPSVGPRNNPMAERNIATLLGAWREAKYRFLTQSKRYHHLSCLI
jgi:nicotinamidase-related amidase